MAVSNKGLNVEPLLGHKVIHCNLTKEWPCPTWDSIWSSSPGSYDEYVICFSSDSKLSPLSLCMCIQGEVVDTYVYQGLKVESLVTVYRERCRA